MYCVQSISVHAFWQTPQIINMDRYSNDIEIMYPTWNTSTTDDISSALP